MKLDDALVGVTRLAIDTAPIIYFIEKNPQYDPIVTEIFTRISNGQLVGITSTLSLTEVLVQPLQFDNLALQRAYQALLSSSDHFQMLPIDAVVAARAADFRARYRLKTPDALQVAVAAESRCEAFLTNDFRFQRVTDLRIIILDDLEL